MSYFVTISGTVTEADVLVPARLIPASKAQRYIANLEAELKRLDGAPVYLVEDGDTGTSEDLVMEVNEALWEGRPASGLPLVVMLERCFVNKRNFRFWLANSSASSHVHVHPVPDINSVLEAIRTCRDGYWHAC